ncbi:DUF2637 domain-containing protein [Streptomyces ovatisporus]|uniref:DUF2637 domain-containing protein n=1 Tax=Streptomyces ovatisporus TaxID=1128682 RepID=A0ABV9AFT2_9ACTN
MREDVMMAGHQKPGRLNAMKLDAMSPEQIKKADKVLSSGTWTITAGAVLYSVLTVTPLVERVTPDGWEWTSPILPIVVDSAVIIVVRLDQAVSKLGTSGGAWPFILRWLTGLMTLALNMGDSALKADKVGMAVHAVAPLLLIVTAEAGLAYRRAINEALDRISDQAAREQAEEAAREQAERERREQVEAEREQAARKERERVAREQREHEDRERREREEREDRKAREQREYEAQMAREKREFDLTREREQREYEEKERERQRKEREAQRQRATREQGHVRPVSTPRTASVNTPTQAAGTPREPSVNTPRVAPVNTSLPPVNTSGGGVVNTPKAPAVNTSDDGSKMSLDKAREHVMNTPDAGVRELARQTGRSVGWVSQIRNGSKDKPAETAVPA